MKNKSITVNAVLNISKQCCAIIFPMITFPYVSRVLGVEAYGKINFSSSIVSYISLLAGLGINSYAIREGARIRDNNSEFSVFINEVFSINILSTFLAYAIMGAMLFFWNNLDSYKLLIVILSLNIFLTTIGTDWINAIYEDFSYLTFRYIICQSISVIATICFVKSPNDIFLYAFLSNLGTISANILNVIYIRKKLKIYIRFVWPVNIKKHLKPILLLFGNMVSTMIYLYSDTTMLGIMIGDIAVGYYTISSKIYSLIKQLINAVSNVITPRISYELGTQSNRANSENKLNNVLGILVLILFPIIAGMIFEGKEIIMLIAGQEYIAAYPALAILSIALFFSTIACVLVSVVMLAQRKDHEILFASCTSAIMNILLNLILIPKYSFIAAALTTMISELIMMSLGIYYTRHIIKINIKQYIPITVLGTIEVIIICMLAKNINYYLFRLILAIGLSALIYGVTLFIWYKNIKTRN